MKKLSLLSLLVVATMLLAACGGAGNTNETPGVDEGNNNGISTDVFDGTEEGGLNDLTGTPAVVGTAVGTADAGNTDGTATPEVGGGTSAAGTSTPSAGTGAGIPVTGPDAMISNLHRGAFLMDVNVVSQDGEDLGEVEELLIDAQNNQVEYVVIGAGGVLGIGETKIAIPWRFLQLPDVENLSGSGTGTGGSAGAGAGSTAAAPGTPAAGGDATGGTGTMAAPGTAMPGLGNEMLDVTGDFVLTVDQSVLAGAPEINLDEIDFNGANWDNEFTTYWNNPQAGGAGAGTGTDSNAQGTGAQGTGTPAAGGTSMGTGSEQGSTTVNVIRLSELLGAEVIDGRGATGNSGGGTTGNSGNAGDSGNNTGTGMGGNSGNSGNTASGTGTPGAASGQATVAPGMGGTEVDEDRETVAVVEDVIINPQSGKVMFVVLDAEDALGLEEDRVVPVPLSSLDVVLEEAGEDDDLVVIANRQNLTQAPNFDLDTFNFGDQSWNSEVEGFWNSATE